MINRAKWSNSEGYECSSRGDKRFSAFFAQMPDGRTIEHWYQCDVKGYNPGGTNWRAGKGKPSLLWYPPDGQFVAYTGLWRIWAVNHQDDLMDLVEKIDFHQKTLRDSFATSEINQAHALAVIINHWVYRQ